MRNILSRLLFPAFSSLHGHRHDLAFLFDNWRRLLDLLAEDVALAEVRQPSLELVADELGCRYGEDLVELLQGELLRLSDEAEDHEPSDQVQTGVKTECTGSRHDPVHTGERQAEDAGEGVVDAHGPGHALLTLDGGEDLSGILEGDWAFSEGVRDREEIDEAKYRQ